MVASDDSLPVLSDGRLEAVQVGGVCEGCVSCAFTGWMDHYVRGRLNLRRCSAAYRRQNPQPSHSVWEAKVMAEIDSFLPARNGWAARTLVSFPEPGVLRFICQSEEDAENLYRDIRASLPDSWFYMEPK